MSFVKHEGVKMRLSGVDYVIPPLNLTALKQLDDVMLEFTGGRDTKNVSIVADVAHAALKRNYPELTIEEVSDFIDLGNMAAIMQAVMGISGLVQSGEAPATASQ